MIEREEEETKLNRFWRVKNAPLFFYDTTPENSPSDSLDYYIRAYGVVGGNRAASGAWVGVDANSDAPAMMPLRQGSDRL